MRGLCFFGGFVLILGDLLQLFPAAGEERCQLTLVSIAPVYVQRSNLRGVLRVSGLSSWAIVLLQIFVLSFPILSKSQPRIRKVVY